MFLNIKKKYAEHNHVFVEWIYITLLSDPQCSWGHTYTSQSSLRLYESSRRKPYRVLETACCDLTPVSLSNCAIIESSFLHLKKNMASVECFKQKKVPRDVQNLKVRKQDKFRRIGLDITTHASPKVGQDQVSGGVSVLSWHAAPITNVLWKPRQLGQTAYIHVP